MNRPPIRPVLLSAAVLAALAGLAGCETAYPRRSGPAVADPNNPVVIERGAPAVSSDGETYSGKGAPAPTPVPAKLPVRQTNTTAIPSAVPAPQATPQPAPQAPVVRPKPAETNGRVGGEPAVDLVEPGSLSQPLTTPLPKPALQPGSKPADTREPAVDLVDPAAPSAPARPDTPAHRSTTPTAPAAANPAINPAIPAAPVDPSVQTLADHAVELITALSRSPQPDVRANAVEAASLIPQKLDSIIIAGLADTNEAVQAIACMSIGKKQLAALAPRCRPLLSSPSPYVETAAIMALARNNEKVDDAKMSRLGEILFTNTNPRVRAHVAFVIGEIRNPSALPMLRQAAAAKLPMAARGEYNAMMLQITEAMIKLGDEGQIETLRAALQPGRPDDLEGTALAIQILGELGDKRPIDHMVYLSAYRDPNTKLPFPAEVRMQVAASLAKLGLNRGGFIADEFFKDADPALRAQAAGVYGETGRVEHLSKLEGLMADPVEQVRITAAGAALKIAAKAGASFR